MSEMVIQLQLPRADYGLHVDLRLPMQGITVLFGPSGSGKTSVLRCVAGLEKPHSARIALGEGVWQDDAQGLFVPTHQRALGYVFQEASLFSHLNVMSNLRFAVQRAQSPKAQAALDQAIELLGIGHLLDRPSAQLSGGERQRVAIARALATEPRLLLLDEPMAALDQARKQEILPWLERLRDELRIPMLYVTHSSDELARLADHLVVMAQGRVKASGPATEVMSCIAPAVVVGQDAAALLQGQVTALDAPWHLAQVAFQGGALWVRDSGLRLGQSVRLRVLAQDVSLTTQEPQHTSIQNHLPCVLDAMAPDAHPSQCLVRVRCGESVLLARVTRRALDALQLQAGNAAWVQVKSVAIVQ